MGNRGNPDAPYYIELRGFERGMLRDALILNNWNIEHTARMLGVSHHFIRTRRRQLGVLRDGETEVPKEEDDEKRENERATSGLEPSDPDQSSDDDDGEADRDDDSEGGDDHRADQS